MKLTQVLAVERNIKGRCEAFLNKLAQQLGKASELVVGFVKTYVPKDHDGEKLPSESKQIVLYSKKTLVELQRHLKELFDNRAIKDATNCVARANVVVGDKVVLKDVPATHLLFLEQQLAGQIIPLIEKLPILDPSFSWTWDDARDAYVTPPSETLRREKKQKPMILAQATEKHPAQVQLVPDEPVVGTWTHVGFSTAFKPSEVEVFRSKAIELHMAVKMAREQANMVEAVMLKSGDVVMEHIFG